MLANNIQETTKTARLVPLAVVFIVAALHAMDININGWREVLDVIFDQDRL